MICREVFTRDWEGSNSRSWSDDGKPEVIITVETGRIDTWYTRRKFGRGKERERRKEGRKEGRKKITQRPEDAEMSRAKQRKRNAETQRAQRREDPPFQKANPKRWATPERCKVKIVSLRMSVIHPPVRELICQRASPFAA